MAYMRGLRPTPRHLLAAAIPHRPQRASIPDFFGVIPTQLDMWGNDQYGDCVSAEEFASKAAYSIWGGPGTELFLPGSLCVQWARQHGWLNGADLLPVIQAMQSQGVSYNGVNYTDGLPSSVDWTNFGILSSAIYQGPVKIGIAANQIEAAVNSTNGSSGWVATGFQHDNNEDHCVGLWGYGTLQQLATLMTSQIGRTINLPAGVNPSSPACYLYTWKTVGIIDLSSIVAITGEAWLRTPTTPQTPVPVPTPGPMPTPGPDPVPVPPVPPTPPVPPVPPTPPLNYTGLIAIPQGPFHAPKSVAVSNGVIVSVQ